MSEIAIIGSTSLNFELLLFRNGVRYLQHSRTLCLATMSPPNLVQIVHTLFKRPVPFTIDVPVFLNRQYLSRTCTDRLESLQARAL